MSINDQLVELYRQMYELTLPECKGVCRVPLSCCDDMYCQSAEDWAKEKWGEDISKLRISNNGNPRFLGPRGCEVLPHHRPMCTLHTCQVNAFGCKLGNESWTNKYFSLRDLIDATEYEKSRK